MNKNMNANNNISTEQVISRYTGNERKVVIPEGVTRIEDGAFKGNKDIVSVHLPLTLTCIGEEAFSGCISLNEINLVPQAPIESIGKAAFKGCTALEGLILWEYHDFFPRTLCDYIYNRKEFMSFLGDLIGSYYYYMKSLIDGGRIEPHPINNDLMIYGNAYKFLLNQINCFFNEDINGEYLNSTWFDYPFVKSNNACQPEVNKILLKEYDIISSYFTQILNGEKPKNIEWERTVTTKLEDIDGTLCQVLYPKHTSNIFYFLFSETTKRDILFKVCKRCERIFPCYYHKNIQFCERVDKSRNETCRQIKFSHLVDVYDVTDENTRQMVLDIFDKAYKRQRRRVDYGSLDKTKFKIWSKKVRKQRDLCLKQKITIREFEEWIKENDWNYEEE